MLREANKPCGKSSNKQTLRATTLPDSDGVVEGVGSALQTESKRISRIQMEPLSASLSVRGGVRVLCFHSPPMSLPGKAEIQTLQLSVPWEAS